MKSRTLPVTESELELELETASAFVATSREFMSLKGTEPLEEARKFLYSAERFSLAWLASGLLAMSLTDSGLSRLALIISFGKAFRSKLSKLFDSPIMGLDRFIRTHFEIP